MNGWRMTTILSFILLLLSLGATATAQIQRDPCQRYPVLFQDAAYQGRSLTVRDSIPDLSREDLGDEVSSLCVPHGWKVILYEHSNYRGDSLPVSGWKQINDLGRERFQGQDFNDRFSSIRVEPPRAAPLAPGGATDSRYCDQYPVLFADDDYEGRRLSLRESVSNLRREGFGDDASSVCVPRGWSVTFYSDSDYRGDTLVLEGPSQIDDLKRDRPGGRDWGDRISSVRLERNRVAEGGEQAPDACRQYPVLYTNDDFRGRSLTLQESEADLHSRRFGDEVSSLCVPSGWTAILYSDTRYRGDSLRISGPDTIADLERDTPGGDEWGDRISSVRLQREGRSGGATAPGAEANRVCAGNPTLYADDDYRGRRLILDESIEDLHRRSFGDEASSLCVPEGWSLVLFSETNYRGSSFQVAGPGLVSDLRRERPQGQDWGDRISSVRVERKRAGSVAPTAPGSTQPCDRYPVLFADSNFSGRRLEVRQSLRDLSSQGFSYEASSLCVPSGWRVFAHAGPDFRGAALEINGGKSIADLRRDRPDGQDWGDRIRSIRVVSGNLEFGGTQARPDSSCPNSPTLFIGEFFRGRRLEVPQSITDLHRLGFGDVVSSACVPAGWSVVLYSETNYRGASLELFGGDRISDLKRDRPDGQDWGDRISSVRIVRRR